MRLCDECGQIDCGRMIERDGSVRPIRDTGYRHNRFLSWAISGQNERSLAVRELIDEGLSLYGHLQRARENPYLPADYVQSMNRLPWPLGDGTLGGYASLDILSDTIEPQ